MKYMTHAYNTELTWQSIPAAAAAAAHSYSRLISSMQLCYLQDASPLKLLSN